MLSLTILILMIAGIYLILNRFNRFTYIVVLYLLGLGFIVLFSIMYQSKVVGYEWQGNLEYYIYQMLLGVRLHISDIIRLLNLSMAIYLFTSLALLKMLKRLNLFGLIVLMIPILWFAVYNDPAFVRFLFIKTHIPTCKDWVRELVRVFSKLNGIIWHGYIIMTFIGIVVSFFKTRIPLKKQYIVVTGAVVLMLDIILYLMVINRIVNHAIFNSIDQTQMLPVEGYKQNAFSIGFAMIIILVIILILLSSRPFKIFSLVNRKDMIDSDKLLNENISMLLHVYKNGFIATANSLGFVMEDVEAQKNEEAKEDIEFTKNIIKDYLEMIDRQQTVFREPRMWNEEVDILECVQQAIAKNSIKGVSVKEFVTNGTIYVKGSNWHLSECFTNVLLNAKEAIEKKNDGNGNMSVSIYGEEDMCMVEFVDNGCGIQKSEIKNIFKPFVSTKTKGSGGGIGLSYVKNVIDKHNGDIRIKSKQGKYTIVRISFIRHYI